MVYGSVRQPRSPMNKSINQSINRPSSSSDSVLYHRDKLTSYSIHDLHWVSCHSVRARFYYTQCSDCTAHCIKYQLHATIAAFRLLTSGLTADMNKVLSPYESAAFSLMYYPCSSFSPTAAWRHCHLLNPAVPS